MNFERGLLRRIGLASTAVGAILFAGLPLAEPAWAGGDNMFSSVTDFFKSPFGGGKPAAGNNANGAIDYRPRPALVVPQTYNLPQPQPHVAHIPDWPKEPDAVALRKAKADSRRPAPPSDASTSASQDTRVITSDVPVTKSKCSTFGMPVCMPWGKHDDNGKLRLRASMPRKYLTDPPVDYTEAVEIPKKGSATEKVQNKAPGGDHGVVRAAPMVDETPPGK
ncbi:hypothetical protein [Methylovirgula sp. HY1]|uniref:hypothetical protein n=1 Tax=Methylovirgula sp. HY1 TaxID=2822761 RepID=UPI001C5B7FA7|nr:hypothetical protein [Methylovirgula sp. HY1]QXX74499.1 hypothetical protein MHY1_01312 [Methylovirgula sp. HY1]